MKIKQLIKMAIKARIKEKTEQKKGVLTQIRKSKRNQAKITRRLKKIETKLGL